MYRGDMDYECRECVCRLCGLFMTKDCLEDADMCNRCDNERHTVSCPWHTEEDCR